MSKTAMTYTDIPGFPKRQGKVRDIYDLGDRLVLVSHRPDQRVRLGVAHAAFPTRAVC